MNFKTYEELVDYKINSLVTFCKLVETVRITNMELNQIRERVNELQLMATKLENDDSNKNRLAAIEVCQKFVQGF